MRVDLLPQFALARIQLINRQNESIRDRTHTGRRAPAESGEQRGSTCLKPNGLPACTVVPMPVRPQS